MNNSNITLPSPIPVNTNRPTRDSWFLHLFPSLYTIETLLSKTRKNFQEVIESSLNRVHNNVPVWHSWLLSLFLSAHGCEAFLGDLEEDYQQAVEMFGARTARFLYWKNALVSLPPLFQGLIIRWARVMVSKLVG